MTLTLSPEDMTAITLSLKVAALATICALTPAALMALVLARGRFPGRAMLDAAVHAPLVLPPVATGYALLLLLGPQGPVGTWLADHGVVFAFHWTGAAIAAAVMAFPLFVRPIRQAIEAIDPRSLEAAQTLGASPMRQMIEIILPLSTRGIVAGSVLAFAKAMGEFGATITFVGAIPGETLTLPTAIYQAAQTPGEEARVITLCLVATALALAAVWASEALSRRITARWAPRRRP